MYSQIDSNKRRTWFLMAIFAVIIIALGYAIGYVRGNSQSMLIGAIIISFVMTLFSYFSGDKVALWSAGAKPVEKNDNSYLYNMVENLSITAGLPMPKVYVMDDLAINAFATGRDPKHASVAVTRGAIDKLENEELEGVIAHELSHIKNYDIRLMTVVIVLVGAIALLSDWFWRANLFTSGRDREERGNPIFAIVGIILIILSPIIAQLIQLAISRRREYLADASGALLTRYPEGLARALEKIKNDSDVMAHANTATAHLYIANPFKNAGKKFAQAFSTHPPLDDRIQKLRQMA